MITSCLVDWIFLQLFSHVWSWLHGPMRPYQHDFSPKQTRISSWCCCLLLMPIMSVRWICKVSWFYRQKWFVIRVLARYFFFFFFFFSPILMNSWVFRRDLRFQINVIKCIICINCPYRYSTLKLKWAIKREKW